MGGDEMDAETLAAMARLRARYRSDGVLTEASHRLREMATAQFTAHGPNDPRGAGIWDCANWLMEVFAEEVETRGLQRKGA